MILAALLLLQAAPQPSAEAFALALRLAETGALATMLPMIAGKDTDDLVAAHPELSATEQAELRRIAAETLATARERLFAAQARVYAERLTLAELRALAAHQASPAAARYREVQPAVIAGTMSAMTGMDFKKEVAAALCAKVRKGCAR